MWIKDLPIDGVIPEIIASLEKTNALVIEAAPGAGKTTRVPVAIDRAEVTDWRMVVVLHASASQLPKAIHSQQQGALFKGSHARPADEFCSGAG